MSVGGWDHRGPSRCRSGLGQPCLPSLLTLRRRWVLGTQILAVKWHAMASFQGKEGQGALSTTWGAYR